MAKQAERLTIRTIREGLQKKTFSALELVQSYLQRIEEKDTDIHAFLAVFADRTLSHARRIDESISRSEPLPLLAGVPCAIKDNILVEGEKCTASSRMLRAYTASYDATVIQKLKEQGVLCIGKTNLDEFAMGSSSENSSFGLTRNPHDTDRVAGGSSGGSAAAVAADMVPLALGSDTGGSIRLPASFCGVVGMKPTYGAVSRYGLISFGSSLDQIGPIANTVEDAHILFQAIRGKDPHDATSVEKEGKTPSSKIVLGVPAEYLGSGIHPQVKASIELQIQEAQKNGYEVREVSLPHTEYALSCYYIIATAEASSNLARYDGMRYAQVTQGSSLESSVMDSRGQGFGNEVRRRIVLGTYVLSSGYHDQYYGKAQKVRTVIKEDFDKVFEKVDALLTPTSNGIAFKVGEKVQDPLAMYLTDLYTIAPNLAGLPALSLPCGTIEGMPVGCQLICPPFQEETLFSIAKKFESFSQYHA